MTTIAAFRASLLVPAFVLLAHQGEPAGGPSSSGSAVERAEWLPGQDGQGKALYRENCKVCHGVLGTPTKQAIKKYEKIPNLTDSAFLASRSDDSVVVVLTKGVGRDMKSFSDKLTVDEMHAVAKYIRTLARKP